MKYGVRMPWMLVALVLLGACGGGTSERSTEEPPVTPPELAACPQVQQGQQFAVCGQVSTGGSQTLSGTRREEGAVHAATPDLVGEKFTIIGGTFHATR